MKRFGFVLLLTLTAFALFANGNQAAPAAGGQSASGVTSTGYPIVTDGSITLRYWTEINAAASRFIQSYGENFAYQEIAKKTGIKIDFIHPATGMVQEQFNLLMASGDLPDLISSANLYRGGEFQGLYDGFFLDLTSMIPQYAPDYYKLMTTDEEYYREVTDDEGKVCAFYVYKPYGDPPANRIILRQDVLDDLGKGIPHLISDYDDLFAAMLAKGIVPLLPGREGRPRQVVGAWDVIPGLYKDLNGKVQYGQAQPGYRQYLEKMAEWYAKGYISKDFTSVNPNQQNTLFDTRKVGMLIVAIAAAFNRNETLGFKVVSAPFPRLTAGQQLHHDDMDIWPLTAKGTQMAAVSAKTKYPEAAVRWLNYGYSPEGSDLYNWGVEGQAYTVVDGKKTYTDEVFYNPRFSTEECNYIYKIHFAPKFMEFGVVCNPNLLRSPDSLAARMKWGDDPNVDTLFSLPPYSRNMAEQTLLTRTLSEINTYTDEMTLKFITGAEPLSRWDTYVQTINSMGLPELIKSEQASYDRYLTKKAK